MFLPHGINLVVRYFSLFIYIEIKTHLHLYRSKEIKGCDVSELLRELEDPFKTNEHMVKELTPSTCTLPCSIDEIYKTLKIFFFQNKYDLCGISSFYFVA